MMNSEIVIYLLNNEHMSIKKIGKKVLYKECNSQGYLLFYTPENEFIQQESGKQLKTFESAENKKGLM